MLTIYPVRLKSQEGKDLRDFSIVLSLSDPCSGRRATSTPWNSRDISTVFPEILGKFVSCLKNTVHALTPPSACV